MCRIDILWNRELGILPVMLYLMMVISIDLCSEEFSDLDR